MSVESRTGRPDRRACFGGMRKMRTWFAADKTGFHMLHTLFQTSLKHASIVRYDEWFVTRLLVDDGRVQGVVAIELMAGRIEAITAKAVILCTGGCGRVFPFTTNANIKNGDGMALAYRAGATAHGHGVRPIPPHRAAVHRHLDYRGGACGGRLPGQQGR